MKLLLTFFLSFSLMAQESNLTPEESESQLLDFSNIKSVLKNDGLVEEKKKKEKIVKQIKTERNKISIGRYNYPREDDFWSFLSEYWLVENAQVLRWDFPKPEYGIDSKFKALLEGFGYYNRTYKILIINSPEVTHFGLPGGKDEYIFIVSLPFIRSMDLTKVDIALLLLEDMMRLDEKLFIQNVGIKTDFLGKNFYKEAAKPTKKMVNGFLKKYSEVILKSGFNFQQQFEITKKMDSLLKSDPSLWNVYFNLMKKIDRLIKVDLLYKNHLKIYPSPELQIQWLSPKKKVI